jgi:ABC-2 type transport system permease protein
MIAVSMGVSARARSSRVALVVLLAFWFATSVIAPRAAADLAAWLYPTPSAVQFQKALDQELSDQKDLQERLDRRKAELFERYKVSDVDALPVAFSGVSLQEGENHGNEVFDRHYGRLFDIYERQNVVFQLAGAAAPMLALRSVSMALAGTDFEQHRRFVAAAENYRRLIQRTMNDDIMAHPVKGAYLAGSELWSRVPDFDYVAPSTGWALANVRASVAILAVWLLAALAWMRRPLTGAALD